MNNHEYIAAAERFELPPSDRFKDDCVTNAFVKSQFSAMDLGLFRTKWFDYRFYSPLQATFLYIAYFEEAYYDFFKRDVDYVQAEFRRPITRAKILNGLRENDSKQRRNFMALWRGRQVADALGMPYPVFLDFAFNARLQNWKRDTLPRPEHLYSARCIDKVEQKWEEYKRTYFLKSDHPAYKLENFCGTADQIAHQNWLIEQAEHCFNYPANLYDLVQEGLLPQDRVEAHLGVQPLSH